MKTDVNPFSLMHQAHRDGNIEQIDLLVKKYPLLMESSDFSWINVAATNKHKNVIDYWLKHGYSVKAPDKRHRICTPLHYAKDAEMTEYLISKGADVNALKYGGTPLHCAIGNANCEQIKILLSHGANPLIQNEDGMTALQFAVYLKREDCIKLLTQKGFSVEDTGISHTPRKLKARSFDMKSQKNKIVAHFNKRLQEQEKRQSKNPSAVVSGIEVGYEMDQAGWLIMHFDERDVHECDGEWTRFIEDEMMAYEKLYKVYDAVVDGNSVKITETDGTILKPSAFTPQYIGKFIAEILTEMVKSNAFDGLKTKAGCGIIIEEFNGNCWKKIKLPQKKTKTNA